MLKDLILEFFNELNKQLFNSTAAAQDFALAGSFIPPDNSHTDSVPAFRAHLHSLGLSEAEASKIIVARTVAGMIYWHDKGYTWAQIDEMPAPRWLEKPTNPHEHARYSRLAKANRDAWRLRQTCGLT